MSETEEQKTEETAEREPSEEEAGAPDETAEVPPVIWSQKRVPNIEKGYNPSVPFYMMGILVALIILSVVFAKITS